MDAVHIIWEDACTEAEWLPLAEATCSTLTITTLGFIVTASDTTLTVCQSFDGHGKTAERLTIPKASIVQITTLAVTGVTDRGNETGVVTV